jgi:hypothetical protein
MNLSFKRHETVVSATMAPLSPPEKQATGERSSSAPCLKTTHQGPPRKGSASSDARPVPRKLSKQETREIREAGVFILRKVHASQEIVAVKFEDVRPRSRPGTCGKQSRCHGKARSAWGTRQGRGRGTMSTVTEVSETEVA